VYETRNETNLVLSPLRATGLNALTVRFCGGFADRGQSNAVRLDGSCGAHASSAGTDASPR
jgi:hypothetical protein